MKFNRCPCIDTDPPGLDGEAKRVARMLESMGVQVIDAEALDHGAAVGVCFVRDGKRTAVKAKTADQLLAYFQ